MLPRRSPLVLVALVGLLGSGVVLGACGGSSSAGPSASSLLKQSQSAVSGVRSFRLVTVSKEGHQSSTIVGVFSAPASEEVLTNSSGTGTLEIILKGSTLYLRGPAEALVNGLGLSETEAGTWAGKWISLSSSDSPFDTLADDLNPANQLSSLTPEAKKATVGSTVSLHGHRAIPISAPASANGSTSARGELTLFVSNHSKLPLGATEVLRKGSTSEQVLATFTRWGYPVNIQAPDSTTPYDQITAAS